MSCYVLLEANTGYAPGKFWVYFVCLFVLIWVIFIRPNNVGIIFVCLCKTSFVANDGLLPILYERFIETHVLSLL